MSSTRIAAPAASPVAGALALVATAKDKIDTIDLTLAKQKLVQESGWTQERADRAEVMYRRFLAMCMIHPDRAIVPTKDIDTMWHQHILDTRSYGNDMLRVFGDMLHHNPYAGLGGDADMANLVANHADTSMIYETMFGEPYRDDFATCDTRVTTCDRPAVVTCSNKH